MLTQVRVIRATNRAVKAGALTENAGACYILQTHNANRETLERIWNKVQGACLKMMALDFGI